MAAPLEMWQSYDHVLSQGDVSEVNRLLRIVGSSSASTSLVLSGELGENAGLMGLRGLGKEIWRGEDAQAYVDRLRQEWGR